MKVDRNAWKARGRVPAVPFALLFLLSAAVECGAGATDATRLALPPPVVDPHSTEIVLNSRISYHGGWTSAATEQMMADVLDATARAPVTEGQRQIYVATPQNVYLYDAASHSLILHKTGDQRSDATAAFEVGVAATSNLDAGAAMVLSQLESVALWTGTSAQLASCPRASAATYANSHWSPPEPVDIAVSFGIRNVPGFTTTLVAVSSDGSLPNPSTDGPTYLDDALSSLAYDSTFAADDLTLAQESQLLWATYGCSNHYATGKAGLVCPSAVANYYLTRRIYAVTPSGTYRYHVRRPPGTDATTRDHRIELVRAGDARPALRDADASLPTAPVYLIVCLGTTGAWPELEVGFAAMGAVLEATSMGLRGYVTAGFTASEQTAIQGATGVPAADLPMAIVSLGHAATGAGVGDAQPPGTGLRLRVVDQPVSGERARIVYALPATADVTLTIHDLRGGHVRTLVASTQAQGRQAAVWDCRDDVGRQVPSGVYFCRLRAGNRTQTARAIVIR